MDTSKNVLVVGAGNMAKEYCRVLYALNYTPVVIGRGEKNADKLEKEVSTKVYRGGIEKAIKEISPIPNNAIIATNVQQLANSTKILLQNNVQNILVEKPAAMNWKELQEVETIAGIKNANVYVAYNRRFYASTERARHIIEEDGGVTSFSFEFTEWSHTIKAGNYPEEIREIWFLANSTHVMDLAFYLGGFPQKMDCYVAGSLDWHRKGCIYAGAGISEKGVLFSYQANWGAPGRWAVEVLTSHHRLYFRPMEKLQLQEIGSVAVNFVELDDDLDLKFKPGLYKQTESFLKRLDDRKKISISEQLAHMRFYEKMENGQGIL